MKKIILILLILTLVSCQNTVEQPIEENIVEVDLETVKDRYYESNYGVTSLKPVNLWVNPLDDMSLEEKVAQLFIVDFRTFSPRQPLLNYSDQISTVLDQYPLGGVIYFKENVESANQVKALNDALQAHMMSQAYPQLFISVDEEGGLVSRLGQSLDEVIYLPKASKLTTEYTLDEVREFGEQLGSDLKHLGFNMNFAPVLDVNTNPNNPIIGTRAFSDEPEIAALYSSAFAEGLMSSSVAAVGKHFPGHGDTQSDSHLGEVTAWMDAGRFETIEKIPFSKAVSIHMTGIMVGHILTPELTTDNQPASLSSEIITDILRDDMYYNGLVITDSLQMKAITDSYTATEVGVLAIEAGCDILLMPENFTATFEGILEAVQSGRIPESRINASVKRILRAKNN